MSSKKVRILKISNRKGLHARASAKFVRCIENFDVVIRVSKDGHVVGGDSIMGLMMLAASEGSELHVSAAGPDADEAMDALSSLIEGKFGEHE
jgi:phosphocarrier protein